MFPAPMSKMKITLYYIMVKVLFSRKVQYRKHAENFLEA